MKKIVILIDHDSQKRVGRSPRIKVNGMYWEFHKGDDDPWPSVPHGHSKDRKYKLQLWSGNIYNKKTGKLEYKAKSKDMKALREYPDFIEFVEECRKSYKLRNPSTDMRKVSGKVCKSIKNRTKDTDEKYYVAFIKHNKVRGN